jgi:hypothetical protein
VGGDFYITKLVPSPRYLFGVEFPDNFTGSTNHHAVVRYHLALWYQCVRANEAILPDCHAFENGGSNAN